MMQSRRRLFWLSAQHDLYITTRHIPGVDNVTRDCLSRLHEQRVLEHDPALFVPWGCYRATDGRVHLKSRGYTSYKTSLYLQALPRQITLSPCHQAQR